MYKRIERKSAEHSVLFWNNCCIVKHQFLFAQGKDIWNLLYSSVTVSFQYKDSANLFNVYEIFP